MIIKILKAPVNRRFFDVNEMIIDVILFKNIKLHYKEIEYERNLYKMTKQKMITLFFLLSC